MTLNFDAVSFHYPNGPLVLRDICLTLNSPNLYLLLGRNGSGKSTLMRLLNGLRRPSMGSIRLNGQSTSKTPMSALVQATALGFQTPDEQLFCRTVLEEVAFGPRAAGRPAAESDLMEVLALTGLTSFANANPLDLHASQRRWLALAALLAMKTPCIALDEPTAGMDEAELDRFLGVVQWCQRDGRLLFVASHEVEFFFPIATRILLLDKGQIRLCSCPSEVVASHELRRLLAGAGIKLPARYRADAVAKYLLTRRARP